MSPNYSRSSFLSTSPPTWSAACARSPMTPPACCTAVGLPGPAKRSPLLEDFVIAQTPLGLQLIGRVTGHPRLGDRMAATVAAVVRRPGRCLGPHPFPVLPAGPPANPATSAVCMAR